jgi:NAD dependent epimerase/dehydratase family enzyme
LCRLFLLGIENNELHGSYNAVAPSPISNKVLTITLAKTLKGSFYIPMHVPAFVLKLMLGQRSIEVLKSTTVSANKIKQAGFVYQYPSIQAALQALATI